MKPKREFHPPANRSLRPEKRDSKSGFLEDAAMAVSGGIMRLVRSRLENPARIVEIVESTAAGVEAMSDAQIRAEARRTGLAIRMEGFRDELVGRSFALIREAAQRSIGLRHFNCQLIGGWALIRGMVAEMETGEGKTLTATLAAGTAALAGIPVHVICVNDYLTARDAEGMGPVYRALGLKVGVITHEIPQEKRPAEYDCDIVYCNNKEVTFDYLRDKLSLGEVSDPLRIQAERLHSGDARERKLLLRGLHFAIADEADSLLVDESRTPLIISGRTGDAEEEMFMREAIEVARSLEEGRDYKLDVNISNIELTDAGYSRIMETSESLGPLWKGTIRRNDTVRKALTALLVFRKDIHYLVREGKVQIIDEYTGRLMPDRSWERGIHQLIEIKEGCDPTRQHEPLARMTYQRFFRRYLHLSGMTGTAWEIRNELWKVYGLTVLKVPTNRPLRRIHMADRVFPTLEEKYAAILARVKELHAAGRPVLVGTRSVSVSEELGRRFTDAGLSHKVLNAKNDREEAEIVALAGELGSITVATNMAGRGTDIKLGPGVTGLEGLHVILTERHEAHRIDRQLEGRCGRQGDPGGFECFLSLEDPILEGSRGGVFAWLAKRALRQGSYLWTLAAKTAILRAQKKMEYIHSRMRHDLLKMDEKIGTMLSFSGKQE